MAACGLESVHFKTIFSEQPVVAVSEIGFCFLHLELILHILKTSSNLVTLEQSFWNLLR